MDPISLEGLLKEEEEKLRNELRADDSIDKNRSQSVKRLNDTLGRLLLRYNAAWSGDKVRQASADCTAASVRETFGLLMAGTAEEEKTGRRFRAGALVTALLAVICCLLSALLIRNNFLIGCILSGSTAVLAFLAGLFWYSEQKTQVHAGIDSDTVWKTLVRTTAVMDQRIDELCNQISVWESEARSAEAAGREIQISPEEMQLFSGLLEALYADNGDYALRQLKKLKPFLRQAGVEVRDYSPQDAELFELLPTKNESFTLRPALLSGDVLLLPGRAAEKIQEKRRARS